MREVRRGLEAEGAGVGHSTVHDTLHLLQADPQRRPVERPVVVADVGVQRSSAHHLWADGVLDAEAVDVHEEPTDGDPAGTLLTGDQDLGETRRLGIVGVRGVGTRPVGGRGQLQVGAPSGAHPAAHHRAGGRRGGALLFVGHLAHQCTRPGRFQSERPRDLLRSAALLPQRSYLGQQLRIVVVHGVIVPQRRGVTCGDRLFPLSPEGGDVRGRAGPSRVLPGRPSVPGQAFPYG